MVVVEVFAAIYVLVEALMISLLSYDESSSKLTISTIETVIFRNTDNINANAIIFLFSRPRPLLLTGVRCGRVLMAGTSQSCRIHMVIQTPI
jgi:hypothetical protein